MKASIISLGCPKNTVESEYMLGILKQQGFDITTDLQETDIAIVHTCSFIDKARKESEKSIRNLIALKKKRDIKIYVSGCLVQLLKESILEKFPQIDGCIGTGSLNKLKDLIKSNKTIDNPFIAGGLNLNNAKSRILSSNMPFSYLKIAEGCNHKCSFCIIPNLRGKYESRNIDSLVKEARSLTQIGIKEIVLIAQDTTSYGIDLYNAFALDKLLVKLSKTQEIKRIRLLYAYPQSITKDLLKTINDFPNICKYIDIPIQHISKKLLSLMNRPLNTRKIIEDIHNKYGKIVLRTSFICGFPQETKQDVKELIDFIKEGHFQYGGVFRYSDNPNATSAKLKGNIAKEIVQERKIEIENAQYAVFKSKIEYIKGKDIEVLIEKCSQKAKGGYIISARADFQAPEIDGNTLFISEKPLKIGSFASVKILSNAGYNIRAKIKTIV
ncbi:MAG: 30S ribosomal protein S12 methylthiotransferase RimO [Elusimicrobiota bacterium]|jgi:ribosomal protein S12 methylthiotransferase|nr:30S ribosomal protein S12 methylthiotransferase RimO [Elusimicrobiota bacterium]